MATNLTTKPPIIVDGTPVVELPVIPVTTVAIPVAVAPAAEPVAYRRVYVWELPVRVFHWVNALAIAVLVVTGYLIGNPQAIFSANEAYQQHWFGWVRFAHFAAGYFFVFNLIFRIYWSFVGNKYARWSANVTYKKKQFKELWDVITTDIIPIHVHGKVAVGHNYLASLSYVGLFIISLAQVVTGFALYADMSSFFLPHLFTWVTPLIGSDALVRQWHHLLMWAFIVFTMIHVYLVFYHDWVEGRGGASSIIGGWKFEKDEDLKD
jgi:Ni/Fe-hydrogenase 1 B-type cytochrome subunit